jgi:hypothetical protein
MEKVPNSVLPIDGLRRDDNGNLTPDALATSVDGLKSRGIDPTDPAMKKKLMDDLSKLLVTVNTQYQTLMAELSKKVNAGEAVDQKFLDSAKEKNQMMTDILNLSRHLQQLQSYDGSKQFIEGWQTGGSSAGAAGGASTVEERLRQEREMLRARSFEQLRKQMVEVTGEKNRVASNYLGLYGFLNIVAVGLLLYAAGMANRQS